MTMRRTPGDRHAPRPTLQPSPPKPRFGTCARGTADLASEWVAVRQLAWFLRALIDLFSAQSNNEADLTLEGADLTLTHGACCRSPVVTPDVAAATASSNFAGCARLRSAAQTMRCFNIEVPWRRACGRQGGHATRGASGRDRGRTRSRVVARATHRSAPRAPGLASRSGTRCRVRPPDRRHRLARIEGRDLGHCVESVGPLCDVPTLRIVGRHPHQEISNSLPRQSNVARRRVRWCMEIDAHEIRAPVSVVPRQQHIAQCGTNDSLSARERNLHLSSAILHRRACRLQTKPFDSCERQKELLRRAGSFSGKTKRHVGHGSANQL